MAVERGQELSKSEIFFLSSLVPGTYFQVHQHYFVLRKVDGIF